MFPVSVPLSASSFHVSIPPSVYLWSPLNNTHSLYRRLLKAEIVPTGEVMWKIIDWSCKVKQDVLTLLKSVMALTKWFFMEGTLLWFRRFTGQLSSVSYPPSLSHMVKFLTVLLTSQPCIGNSDQRFLELVSVKPGCTRYCVHMYHMFVHLYKCSSCVCQGGCHLKGCIFV